MVSCVEPKLCTRKSSILYVQKFDFSQKTAKTDLKMRTVNDQNDLNQQ